MKPVRVLIVDDSATMRGLIAAALSRDPQIEVVGQFENPIEARQGIKDLNPEVVTLDIEMPRMSGLEFLEKLMRLRPTPVIMVSTLTRVGADQTITALELGAVDCIEKPRPGAEDNFDQLASKVKAAAGLKLRPLGSRPARATPMSPASDEQSYLPDGRLIAIGASTGGVEALIEVLSHFPANCAPTVIAQHMPAMFTTSFANRLDRICAAQVEEAKDGAPLTAGRIYLAPGGASHLTVTAGSQLRCSLRSGDKINGHCPSVDVLFESVAKVCKSRAVGAILTGMGRDGAAGLLAMRSAGANTFGQNESSSIVYGMPRVAFEMGGVEKQLPIGMIGQELISATSLNSNKWTRKTNA
ncbi:MAG: chemotaxis response regulator protein-glutamate methylesterase [Hyphomicrobium sp.]|nr:chemotaxis response regulator protein-glutamate methylesterase [Hyphomicrobium sp.]